MQKALIIRVTAPERNDSRVYRLAKDIVRIGRDPGSDIVLGHPGVSWEHALILSEDKGFAIQDCNSVNGTIVNGRRLSRGCLRDDDRIMVGRYHLQFEFAEPEPYETRERPYRMATVRMTCDELD